MLRAKIGNQQREWFGELEQYFNCFRKQIIGIDKKFLTPYGEMPIIYADWTASGRLYKPIEDKIAKSFGPYMANTHTESNQTGSFMTNAYHHAKQIIKKHVNASQDDVILLDGFGMTSVINKFQRILGLRIPEKWKPRLELKPEERPVVFITHREHHSNHTSWLETIADVVIVEPDEKGNVQPQQLDKQLKLHTDRAMKIGAFTA